MSRDPAPPPAAAALPETKTPLWRRLFPFVFAGGLTALVLWRVDWPTFSHAIARTNVPLFVAFMVAFVVGLLATDTLATAYVYRDIGRASYRDLFVVRGASYLPTLVNHHVGQAWLTYLLAKVYRVPIKRVASGTLFAYATWGGCLLLLLCLGVFAGRFPRLWGVLGLGAGVAYLILLAIKPAKLAHNAVLKQLFDAGPLGHIRAMLWRIPHLTVLFVGTWVPFLIFGIDVPFADALVPMTVIMVSTALPLTPVGVGTRDAMAVALLQSYVVGASSPDERIAVIAASTASVGVVLTVVEALLALLLTRGAQRLAAEGVEAI